MNIQTFTFISTLVITGIFICVCNILDKRDKEINGTNPGYRSPVIKMASLIAELAMYVILNVVLWFLFSILITLVVHENYSKDTSIGSMYETEYIDSIEYTSNKYILDNKYTVADINRVHTIEDDKAYIKYPKRIDIGPFYYIQGSIITDIKEIELYIPKEVVYKVGKLKAESIVYKSNKK